MPGFTTGSHLNPEFRRRSTLYQVAADDSRIFIKDSLIVYYWKTKGMNQIVRILGRLQGWIKIGEKGGRDVKRRADRGKNGKGRTKKGSDMKRRADR